MTLERKILKRGLVILNEGKDLFVCFRTKNGVVCYSMATVRTAPPASLVITRTPQGPL